MATKNAVRTIQYQHVIFQTPQTKTLEQLLRDALTQNPRPIDRERDLGQDVRQVWNDYVTVGNTLCGILWHWVDGKDQIVFDRDPTATVWAVQPVKPPTTAKSTIPRHFLESMLFFGVRGNHMVVVQTQWLRAAQLAQYFTWFVRDKSTLVATTEQLAFGPASAAKLRQAGIQRATGITISRDFAEITYTPPNPKSRSKKPIQKKSLRAVLADKTSSLLTALNVPIPQNLLLGEDARDLEIQLKICRPYDRSVLGNNAMVALAKSVAQLASDDYEIQLGAGSVLKGSELVLARKINVHVPANGGHPSPQHVFTELDSYLNGLITRGEV